MEPRRSIFRPFTWESMGWEEPDEVPAPAVAPVRLDLTPHDLALLAWCGISPA